MLFRASILEANKREAQTSSQTSTKTIGRLLFAATLPFYPWPLASETKKVLNYTRNLQKGLPHEDSQFLKNVFLLRERERHQIDISIIQQNITKHTCLRL